MTTPDPTTPGTPEEGAAPTPAGGAGPQQTPPAYPGAQPPAGPPAPGPQPYPGQPYAGQQGQYAPTYGQPQPENPGKTLGIVGLVLAFLGPLSLVGLILSIVGLVKSRKVGQPNGVAIAGIVVGALVLIGTIVLGVAIGVAANHFIEVCNDLGPGEHVQGNVTYTCP